MVAKMGVMEWKWCWSRVRWLGGMGEGVVWCGRVRVVCWLGGGVVWQNNPQRNILQFIKNI